MIGRLTWTYPFLFVAVLVLHLADANPGYYDVGELLLVLAAGLAAAGVIYAAVALVLRGRGGSPLAALITFLLLLLLFSREPLRALGIRGPFGAGEVALALGIAVAGVLAVRWVARRPRVVGTLATFLTLTAALLVLRSAAGIAVDLVRGPPKVAGSALVQELARPIPGPDTVPGPVRDVYLIVLDEYANADVLRDVLGYDNRPFLDSLRALGFHLPAATSSNYLHTVHSLPSLLNAAHLNRLEAEPDHAPFAMVSERLFEESRVAAFLQARGYRYVYFPSAWWVPTRSNPLADSVVPVGRGLGPAWKLSSSEFRRSLWRLTVLNHFYPDYALDARYLRRTLEGFGRLPSIEGPVFGVAHVIAPHSPYVFDAGCRPARTWGPGGERGLYAGQLQCLNRMVLALVHRLLRDSEVPPVILLQGDHGSNIRRFYRTPTAERMSAPAVWERFGAFGAYYLPGGGAASFGDSVSVVNVLGNVLRGYFGAELPRQPDDHYMTAKNTPFHYVRADPAWIATGAGPDRPLPRAHTSR